LGSTLLVLAALALPVGLLLSGFWLRTVALYRLELPWISRRLPPVWWVLTWFAKWRFDGTLASKEDPQQEPRVRNRAAARFRERYPRERRDVLPSCFGNVVSALEEYTDDRWGLDYRVTAPHIATLLNDQERALREGVETQLAFALNLAFVLSVIGVAGFSGAVWGQAESIWRASEIVRMLPLLVAYAVYRLLGIPAAIESAHVARASFDLHRIDLYCRLATRDTSSFGDDERNLGEDVSAFLLSTRPPKRHLGRSTMRPWAAP
jgi:hypothetical protein